MPTLHAQIHTERATRYLVQFCRHAAAMGDGGHTPRMHLHTTMTRGEVQVSADWSDTSATVTFTPWGQCTLAATDDNLTLRIEAADEHGLARIREVVDRDLQRFSRRNPLTVSWRDPETPGAAPFRPGGTVTPKPRQRGLPRTRLPTILLALAAVLVITLHIGLVGAAVAHSRWTGIAVDIMGALVVLKIAVIAWPYVAKRRRATRTPITSGRDQS